VYPFPTPLRIPGETLGSVQAATSSSSHPFLKVLLGMRRFEVLGVWWEFSEGRSGCDIIDITFFSFLFLFLFYLFFLLG
jgi:hypothetical protein